MQSKNAIGNLLNRYKAVLNKCNILNTFGTLTLASGLLLSPMLLSDANAVSTNPSGTTVDSMDATDGSFQTVPNSVPALNDPILENYGTISGGVGYSVSGGGGGGVRAGMYGFSLRSENYNFSNFGNINITQNATEVYGMHASVRMFGDHKLTNSGTITITVGQGTIIAGMNAHALTGDHKLSNSGTISVSGNDFVYGMRVGGSGTHNLSNTGYITASARSGEAYEAYGNNSYNVDTWATTLRTWTGNDTVFGAAAGVNVNFNNSRLIFRPGTAAQGFALGKVYNIVDMVAINNTLSTAITGTIASIETEVPFLKATMGGTATAPTVALESNISAKTTPGIASMQQAVGQVQGQFNNISKSLRNTLVRVYRQANLTTGANAGSQLLPEHKWETFFTPYAISTSNSDLDFSGNNIGITGGFNYHVNEQFSLGAHLDFNAGTFHSDILNTDSKSNSFALGVHANYNISDEWYVRAQITASTIQSNNNYEIEATAPLTADAVVNSTALQAAIATGYIWNFGQGHSLNAEIGFGYMNLHTFAYDINWAGPSATSGFYDLSYDDSNYSSFYTTFNLDWRSEFQFNDNNSLALLAGAGIRQKLNDTDIETDMQILGSKYTAKYTEDTTTFLANVGAEWKINDFSVMLKYDGEYGNTQTSHGGSVIVKLKF